MEWKKLSWRGTKSWVEMFNSLPFGDLLYCNQESWNGNIFRTRAETLFILTGPTTSFEMFRFIHCFPP